MIVTVQWDSDDADALGCVDTASVLFFLRQHASTAPDVKPAKDKQGYTTLEINENALTKATTVRDVRSLNRPCERLAKACRELHDHGGPFPQSSYHKVGKLHAFDVPDAWLRPVADSTQAGEAASAGTKLQADPWSKDKTEHLLELMKTSFPSVWQRVSRDISSNQLLALWRQQLDVFPVGVLKGAVNALRAQAPFDSELHSSYDQAMWNPFDIQRVEEACWRTLDQNIGQYIPGFASEREIWNAVVQWGETNNITEFAHAELQKTFRAQIATSQSHTIERFRFLAPFRALKLSLLGS